MRRTRRNTVLPTIAAGLAAAFAAGFGTPAPAAAQPSFELPDNVASRAVDIWSEGTRLAGDLYWPQDATGDLPAIVMSHGWGGTKASLVRNAAIFRGRRLRRARLRLPRLGREATACWWSSATCPSPA